jgi:hypothetical protein
VFPTVIEPGRLVVVLILSPVIVPDWILSAVMVPAAIFSAVTALALSFSVVTAPAAILAALTAPASSFGVETAPSLIWVLVICPVSLAAEMAEMSASVRPSDVALEPELKPLVLPDRPTAFSQYQRVSPALRPSARTPRAHQTER